MKQTRSAVAQAQTPTTRAMPYVGVAARPEEPREDEVILSRYRVLARRGTGGFGAVCTCWDTRLQRRVAIKRMPISSEAAGGRVMASTLNEALAEARTASLLAHPNIVQVFDFETDGAYAYLVMEYIDGLNLAELLARVEGGHLTHDETAHMLQGMANALAYAHENGALHLDIKPTNIMIDRTGAVKLTDFGMATLASATGFGDARGGTVGYMPPEQIQGGLVDERTDIFSLAVVVWQALVGASPFMADNANLSLSREMRGPKPTIAQLDPDLPRDAADAIMRAVAADPAARMTNVYDFSAAVLDGLGNPAEGAASLASLVEQSTDEEDEPETQSWTDRHLPFLTRFPWAETAFERIVAAATTAYLCYYTLPVILTGAHEAQLPVAVLILAAATAAWPPLGSILAVGCLALALGTALPTGASFPLAALVAILLLCWWAAFGRRDHLASPALLSGSALSAPPLGAPLAAFALNPLPATVTSFAGAGLALLWRQAFAFGYAAQPTAESLLALLAAASTWIMLAGSAFAGLVGSAITCRGTISAGIVGQVATMGILFAALAWAARVENGGIWVSPDAHSLALAVVLCLILSIACALRGPLEWD